MLSSPCHAVVASRAPHRSAQLLGVFGLEMSGQASLPKAAARSLYGLEEEGLTEIMLGVPGAESGGVCLVETPNSPRPSGPYDPRPIAVDFYTRDIERSRDMARAEGLHLGELVDYAVGPLQLKEFEAEDQDGLRLVFIEIENRRPSVLDRAPERLHSEVHSIVFAVADAEASLRLWRDTAGLEVLVDAPIAGPVISQLMGLPRPNVPVRFILLCDHGARSARFEVLQFVEDPGAPAQTRPLAAGLDAAAFLVDDLAKAQASLTGATFSDPVSLEGGARGIRRAVAGQGLDGIRFELWQR